MSQKSLQQFKDTFLVANGYSDITESRINKLKKSRHASLFVRFFVVYLFKELQATKSGNYCTFVFENETFWIATEAVVNSLHHTACKYAKENLNLDTIKGRFKNDIFFFWNEETNQIERIRSPREWVDNLRENFRKMNDLLGNALWTKILKVLSTRISQIEKSGSFHPNEQWKLQAIDTICQKITFLLGHLESRGFNAKEKLDAIVDEYKKLYQQNTDSLHFCNFLSYFKEITETYISLYYRNEVFELRYLAGLGEQPTGDGTFNEPSWNLISSWAKKYSLQLNGYKPNPQSPTVNFSHPTDFWENVGQKKYGFQNLRDFYWNKKLIEGANDCPPILKACLAEKDPIRSLEQVALEMAWLLSDAGSLTEVINCKNGLLALYETDNEGIFLRMIYKLDKMDFLKWAAIQIIFSPHWILESFKRKEAACTGLLNTKSARYYRKHPNDMHKNCDLLNQNCTCLSEKYTENDIRLIVLRFLLDGPCFKTASTLVVRLTKHYKKGAESRKDFLDRLEMLKGQNIGLHARQYLSLAKRLVYPECGDSNQWMDAHRPHYIYRFSSSGGVSVTFGRWDGTKAGIFAILSIRENGEVYLKTLWSGNPTSFSQAKLFGVQEYWRQPEGPEKRLPQKKLEPSRTKFQPDQVAWSPESHKNYTDLSKNTEIIEEVGDLVRKEDLSNSKTAAEIDKPAVQLIRNEELFLPLKMNNYFESQKTTFMDVFQVLPLLFLIIEKLNPESFAAMRCVNKSIHDFINRYREHLKIRNPLSFMEITTKAAMAVTNIRNPKNLIIFEGQSPAEFVGILPSTIYITLSLFGAKTRHLLKVEGGKKASDSWKTTVLYVMKQFGLIMSLDGEVLVDNSLSERVEILHFGARRCPVNFLRNLIKEWNESQRKIKEIIVTFLEILENTEKTAECLLENTKFLHIWSENTHEESIYNLINLGLTKENLQSEDVDVSEWNDIQIFLAISQEKERFLFLTLANNAISLDAGDRNENEVERSARKAFARFSELSTFHMVNNMRLKKVVKILMQ